MLGAESLYIELTIEERIQARIERHFGHLADVNDEVLESLYYAFSEILSPKSGGILPEIGHFTLYLRPVENSVQTFSLSIDYSRDYISLKLNKHTLTINDDIDTYRTFWHAFEITISWNGNIFEITTPILISEKNRIIRSLTRFSPLDASQVLTEIPERRNLRTADLSGVYSIIRCLREGILPEDI